MTLVFIHGAGGSGLSFHYQARYFEDSHAIDLPGYPDGKPYTSVESYTEWFRGFVRGRGYKDMVLVGHSMGGAIAQLYAINYAEELKGLVLIGTGARLKVHPNTFKECEEAKKDATKWLSNYEASLWRVAPDLRRMLVEKRAKVGPAVQLNDLLCCDRFDAMGKVREITTPTLVICGVEDVMTPVKYARYLADNIPGARCRIVPEAGHAVMMERPDEVNRVIEEFVVGLSPATGSP